MPSKRRAFILSVLGIMIGMGHVSSQSLTLTSPSENISVSIECDEELHFKITHNGQTILDRGTVSLTLEEEVLGRQPKLIKQETGTVNAVVTPVVPLKNKEIDNHYNALRLYFENEYQVEFRAFDNGIGYRFLTTKDSEIVIENEQADYQFADNFKAYLSETKPDFSNYENIFQPMWLEDFTDKEDALAVLPAYVNARSTKILIAEADVRDYPAMFVEGGEGRTLKGWFPNNPEKAEIALGKWWSDRRLEITATSDYIAKTKGNRSFPWRIFTIAEEDKDIATSDLVYLLSSPSEFNDFSWIKPGQTSWEWWHASNIIGVDFKAGYNTATYKYYIDFASNYGMEYMLMDEGWSFSVTDISKPNPEIDLEELVRYATEKGVEIILWASWLSVENTPTFFEQVKAIGAAGVKIDFMDRSDQWMMNYYERTAKRAFEHELLVDFHGSISPRGLRRAYPNIISYEGLTGMEQNKAGGHDKPNNRVILPFTRNVVGPMDYTPGAMNSVHPKYWHANWTNPMSIGTRAHQLALFIVFESGLQMLADNPSDYYKEDECTKFITDVPTTWDETVVLSGKIGEHIVTAKRKGNDWFIGGITNDKGRDFTLDFSFLNPDKSYSLTLFTDGINADSYAADYKRQSKKISPTDKLPIKLVMNGGFAAKVSAN